MTGILQGGSTRLAAPSGSIEVPSDSKPARKDERERGQAMVEMAIVMPFLLLLVLGIMEFGFVFNSYLEIRSASREGARLAAVDNACFPTSPDYGQPRCAGTPDQQRDALKADTIARAAGLANEEDIVVEICYDNPPQIAASNVQVTLKYHATSLTGFFDWALGGFDLSSRAVMRMEQLPTYSEDPAPAC